MKTLIALSIALASLTFHVQAQSDTIEFNASIPTKNLSMDEVHGILMNYLALKCDNWMQVIQLRNTSNGQITLYLKLETLFNLVPLKTVSQVKRTYKFVINSKSVNVFAQYPNFISSFELALYDFNSLKRELDSFLKNAK
jgi:hypothetical protein